MKKLLAALLVALLPGVALAQNPSPAQWQGVRNSGDSIIFKNSGQGSTVQSSSNPTGGAVTPTPPAFQYLSGQQYGPSTCYQQMFKVLSVLRSFFTLDAKCGTDADPTTASQFIDGFFSIDDYSTTAGSAIPIIAQAIAETSNKAEYGINTVHLDSPAVGYASAGTVSGTTFTAGGTITGSFHVGDWLGCTAGCASATQITAFGTGTGGAGTYTITPSQPAVGPTLVAAHTGPSISGITEQDELDFFAWQPDTRARLLIDGFFPGPQTAVFGRRVGVLVGLFNTSVSDWQIGFQSGNGGADTALVAGTTSLTAGTGIKSQPIQWGYQDNTSSAAYRYAELYADPTNAGATGTDMVFDNAYSYNAPVNLSIANGSLKADGKNVVSSTGAAVHTMFLAHAEGVTGNATTCAAVTGVVTAGPCGSPAGVTFQMQGNQSGQISNMVIHVQTAPGTGNNYVINFLNNSAILLTCTIADTNTNCAPSGTTTVAITSNTKLAYQIVASAGAPTAQMTFAVSFDNPAP